MMKSGLAALVLAAACGESAPRITAIDTPVQHGMNSADPALAVDPGTGDVLMTWVAGDTARYDLFFARSHDTGATWTDPVRIAGGGNEVKPHGQASPRLVAANGVVVVVWPSNIVVEGRRFPASHMRFSRSTDGGRTWSAPVTLNDDTTSALAGHTFHGAAFVPPSTIAVAWLDSRSDASAAPMSDDMHHAEHDGDATVYMTTSKDLGATWAAQNTKLWGDACPCCRVSLAARPDGQIVAAWRSHLPGDVRDPVVALIGDTVTQPARVSNDNWVFAGCPHTGPGLQVGDDGTTRAAWYSVTDGRSGIFYSETDGESLEFREPVEIVRAGALPTGHPVVAANGRNTFVAYDVGPAGKQELLVARVAGGSAKSTVLEGSAGADHPQIIVLEDGRAVVAWAEKRGKKSEARLALVE